ncbi:aminodeoxychorismate synthase component I [Candidatus Nitrosacidococcus sp. I8]|uniref:aminodeoxychorismate synthase component I n=1 Tax=Candidatus Nitrosacidococcus sp. I8 TaxID=2942908 RepID=UPI002227F900|nr:aminodeoxychorismate synthase component I [Candidatus Nitrosacidococcus sp. I8]CAH9014505.1 Aminodeoxychorismate synthase component 1 [Candidatus Nitrosacidococcus sp. I8]
MHQQQVQWVELPYSECSASLFETIYSEPWPIFLDSGWPSDRSGRFDIIAADPFITLKTKGLITEIGYRTSKILSTQNSLILLQRELDRFSGKQLPNFLSEIPLSGGAMGYFSYDLARRFETLPSITADIEQMPEMAIGIYDWVVIVDHHCQATFLVTQGYDPHTQVHWDSLKARLSKAIRSNQHFFHIENYPQSNLSKESYNWAFDRIQNYICAGDCYQVNLAQRFESKAYGDSWALYSYLREINPAPFSSFFSIPEGSILSTSPERFLKVSGDRVETIPIKGTRPRDINPVIDTQLAVNLQNSSKDQAENIMIVDLLRNDLGRVCTLGSIQVMQLCTVQSFATVHHLASTIHGQLASGKNTLDLLQACFPGGSITGAPKIRAMEIIEELEPHRRGIYCGSLGYISFEGNMDINIAIRTLVYNQNSLRFWVGSGIVADSDRSAEYQETLDKAAAIFQALNPYYR